MKTLIPFNVNDYILVKLTEKGELIYGRSYARWNLTPPAREDGWVRMQMWDFMQMFGEHSRMGSELPYETAIKIEVEVEV